MRGILFFVLFVCTLFGANVVAYSRVSALEELSSQHVFHNLIAQDAERDLAFPSEEPPEGAASMDELSATPLPEQEFTIDLQGSELSDTDTIDAVLSLGSTNKTSKAAGKGNWVTIQTRGQPQARHEACYVAAPNGKHYLIGGRKVNSVSIFHPITKVWTKAAGPGVEIHHMQCVATRDGRIWIPSSWYGSYPREKNHAFIFIFDTRTNKWSRKPGLPEPRRRGGAAAVLRGGKIYVSHGNRGGHGGHATSLGWLDAYDIVSNQWITNLPTAPNARDHTGGGIIGGRLCVAGGRKGGENNFQNKPVRATDCYNFSTRKWSVEAPIPVGRAGSAYGTTCGRTLAVVGGEGFGKAFNDVNFFNGKGWTNGPKLNRARHGTGVAVTSCGCGQISVASGSGKQGGGPQLKSVETLIRAGQSGTCK